MPKSVRNNQLLTATLVLIACLLYFFFAYRLSRTEIVPLFIVYALLFVVYIVFIKKSLLSTNKLLAISFLFRFLFLLAIPNLSQDFYRFIWDGRMMLEGLNPYLYLPDTLIFEGVIPFAQTRELYDGMGMLSATNYTNYPPINQLCFLISAVFARNSILGSVVVLRLIVIAADFGVFYFGKKLLQGLKIPVNRIFWYLLNPFIIIELTGNLHFEGVMIFFLVWSLYMLHCGRWRIAAVLLAFSVSVKLLPLVFLPLFFQYFIKGDSSLSLANTNEVLSYKSRIGRLLIFYLIMGAVVLLLFIPFFSSSFIHNYAQTVGLWFHSFEFNASIYYLSKELYYSLWGNAQYLSIILPAAVFIFIVIIAFCRKNESMIELVSAMLLGLSFYFLLATTVHPWYISTLVILSIFTKYKFPLVWSFIIILSYVAYSNPEYHENPWILGIEYFVVSAFLIWELVNIYRSNKVINSQ